MIGLMRRLLFTLLILLLPLRGWVTDAMAMQTLTAAAAAPLSVATRHVGHCDMHPDGMSETAMLTQVAPASNADTHVGSSCTTCQFCHAATLTVSMPLLATLPLPSAPPVARLPVPTSAVSVPDLKPPIS